MVFTSLIFLFIFLPIVLGGYFILFRKNKMLQNVFLTVCSLFFYAWGEPKFVIIMIISIIINWLFALCIDKYREHKTYARIIIISMLITNLSILFVYKYLGFVLENINSLFNMQLDVPQITLPIGISFFTFQAISYVIDIYRKDGKVQKNLLNVAFYIAFFPQLIAGPIVRYSLISEEITDRKVTFKDFTEGCYLFMCGMAKKILLSNTFGIIADTAFGTQQLSVMFAWVGAIAYTFQIFYDFSGYSDMAVGLGRMFGFHFPNNFNYPYISTSISEFWRRWHISLGSWFRDYVYIPLGGNRVAKKSRLIINLFVVWLLTGIWHGANWTFIVWGIMYFILIALEKAKKINIRSKWLGHVYTMFFVIIGWVIFRANDMEHALNYLKSMFGVNNTFYDGMALVYLKENIYFIIAAILCAVPIKINLFRNIGNKIGEEIKYLGVTVLFLVAIIYLINSSYNPFIYFNF